MSMFHKHRWVEVERFVAEPMNGKTKNVAPETVERLMLGVTTILYRCRCSETQTEEILGISTAPSVAEMRRQQEMGLGMLAQVAGKGLPQKS